MINWTMFQPRNLFIIGAMAVLAYAVFNHFSKGNK